MQTRPHARGAAQARKEGVGCHVTASAHVGSGTWSTALKARSPTPDKPPHSPRRPADTAASHGGSSATRGGEGSNTSGEEKRGSMDKRAKAGGDGALDGGAAAGKQARLALPPAMSTGARRLKPVRPVGLTGASHA